MPRYFIDGSGIRIAPEKGDPRSRGIDTRMLQEVTRPSEPGERWVGPNRGWVRTAASIAAADQARSAAGRGSPEHAASLEERLAAVEARLAAIEDRLSSAPGANP